MNDTDDDINDDHRPLRPPPRPEMTPVPNKVDGNMKGVFDTKKIKQSGFDSVTPNSTSPIFVDFEDTGIGQLSKDDLEQVVKYSLWITQEHETYYEMIRSKIDRLLQVSNSVSNSDSSSVPFSEASTPTMRSSRPLRSLVSSPSIEPPLLLRSRSHDEDLIEEPVLRVRISSESSPSNSNLSLLPRLEVQEQELLKSNSTSSYTAQGIPKSRQLVVLCSRKPATAKEGKEQDLAMVLCKRLGIIPQVILSEERPSVEETILIDAMRLVHARNAIDTKTPIYYPQFFVRTHFEGNPETHTTVQQKSVIAAVEYKGDYNTMESLTRCNDFDPKSLSMDATSDSSEIPATNTSGLTTNDRERLELLIRETNELRRKLDEETETNLISETARADSAGNDRTKLSRQTDPSAKARDQEETSQSDEPHSRPQQQQNLPKGASVSPPTNPSRSVHMNSANASGGIATFDSNDSFHLSSINGKVENSSSYSHLDGLNQPKMNSNSSSACFGEVSLGDDLRMIFDIDEPSTNHETNSMVTHTRVAGVTSVVPTITEDEEYEDEEEDTQKHEGSQMTEAKDHEVEMDSATKSMKREIVTLRRAQKEPPGAIVTANAKAADPSGYLGRARSSLQNSSPRNGSSNVSVFHSNTKPKIINPYYALDEYSGGKGFEKTAKHEDHLTEGSSKPVSEIVADLDGQDPPDETSITYDGTMDARDSSWEHQFMDIEACYLVLSSRDDELQIYYSESPLSDAVGVWTSPDIKGFRDAQGLSECALIGTCASNVMFDHKNYYRGWCQFIKAAKTMGATVTILEGMGVPVDFYAYNCERSHTTPVQKVFDTRNADAIACVPKDCTFPTEGIVGKKWGKIAKKLGAVVLFKSLSSKSSSRENVATATIVEESTADVCTILSTNQDESVRMTNPGEVLGLGSSDKVKDDNEVDKSVLQDTKHNCGALKCSAKTLSGETTVETSSSLSLKLPCPEEGACYLVYNPDSSGQLVEHYSKIPVNFAIGRWVPGPGKKIAGFKFKRNLGRNVLIGHCAAGVQGRKNYNSGWCQFVRSAKMMGGDVVLWDPLAGHKGLKVDVYLYFNDARAHHQTVRMEEGIAYSTDGLLAVACLPKNTQFFEDMTVDLLMWLAEASKHGYSTKL